MKTYEALFNEDETDGVFGISLVHDPAMEGVFIALNKQEEIRLAEVDKEQRILMGLVLEPNKPIYRNQNGEEFNIVFNEDTIKKLSYNFFKTNSHKNSNIEHESKQKIDGVTFVESWIVEDPKNDKSNLYGFSYPKGTWFATMKVDNNEVWDEYVKTGKVKGFSIEAALDLKEINLKSNINMSNEIKEGFERLTDKLLVALSLKQAEVKLGSVKTMDGSITFEFDGEELVAGAAIFAVAETGEKIPVPVGDYELEDGRVLSIVEDGIIGTIGEVVQQDAPAEMQNAAPSGAEVNQIMDSLEKSVKSVMIKYAETFNAELTKANQTIADLQKEVLKLSEQPAAKPFKSQPTQVELNKQGRILDKLRSK